MLISDSVSSARRFASPSVCLSVLMSTIFTANVCPVAFSTQRRTVEAMPCPNTSLHS